MIDELQRNGIGSQKVLTKFHLTVKDVSEDSMFVHAPVMYAIVEGLAKISRDPHFGVRVGERLDPFSWPPLSDAAELSSTVGEFLARFLIGAADHESSVTYVLETRDFRTRFHEKRKVDGNIRPAHNDGFTVAYLLTVLRKALGSHWNGDEIKVRLCDPGVLPVNYLGVRTAPADTLGPSIEFPSEWLILPLSVMRTSKHNHEMLRRSPLPSLWIDSFRTILQQHIHEFGLNSQQVSDICGYSKRTLARKLNQHGTSFRREIVMLRRTRAEDELINSTRPINEVAAMIGYLDCTVFSHAFKRWTGLSPRNFRKAHYAV